LSARHDDRSSTSRRAGPANDPTYYSIFSTCVARELTAARAKQAQEEENNVKRQFLAATTAIAIAISVGSAFAAEKKQLYFVPNGAVDFWKLAEAGMKKAQAELPNYK
jgi:hypothetical protein